MYKLTATLPNGLTISQQSAGIADLQRIAIVKQAVKWSVSLHGEIVYQQSI